MNKKNLYIVASPLQFLNALEAREHFKTTNNILLLIFDSKKNSLNSSQIERFVKKKDWDEIINYDKGKVNEKLRIFSQIKLIYTLKKDTYNYIISGEEGTFNRILFANLDLNLIYLVDDGIGTIDTYQKMITGYYSSLSFFNKLRFFRYILFGLKTSQKKINLFTLFDLKPTNEFEIIKNNFTSLKSRMCSMKTSKDIYILGQSLVQANIIQIKDYIKTLELIKFHFNDETIIYIPHRSEEITSDYNKLIDSKFIIKQSTGPIELKFIEEGTCPSKIISFYSTALCTLNKIYADVDILSVKLDPKKLAKNRVDSIEECYNLIHALKVPSLKLS